MSVPEVNEVQEKVLNEIKAIGENTKKQNEELQNSYSELKHSLNEGRKETDEKIKRLQEDLVTRQEKLDETLGKLEKKSDNLEIAFKRPGGVAGNESPVDMKEVKEFYNQKLASSAGSNGLKFHELKNFDFESHADEYKTYAENFRLAFLKEEKMLTPEQAKALSVGVDPDGGYLVPPQMSNKIIERIYELSPIRQLCNVENISSDSLEITSDWDEFAAGWVTETSSRDETDTAKLGMEKIFAHEMYAKPKATQKLIEDATVNIESWISRKVSNRFARLEGTAFVTGDGVGKPRGFLTYTSGSSEVRGTIEQVDMGAAASLTADGFINVKYALVEDLMDRGTWIMNRSTVAATMLLKDGNGQYLWRPGLSAGQPSTILGSPVRMATDMPTVAADALAVAFADWMEAYTIVDRIGITVLRDPYSDKPFVQFYTRKRVGGQVVNFQAIKLGKISA